MTCIKVITDSNFNIKEMLPGIQMIVRVNTKQGANNENCDPLHRYLS